jgi:hypothetical protein
MSAVPFKANAAGRHHVPRQWHRVSVQATTATAEDGMIGDGDIDPEQIGNRTQKTFGLTQRLVELQAKRKAGLDGDRRMNWLAPGSLLAGACHAATASAVNHTVRLARRTNAASYSGQFVTRYLALENLWPRLSVNLYGMSFHNQQCGTAGRSDGRGAFPPPFRH